MHWFNRFRRLQWKLTLSYTVTTVLTDLLLLGIVIWLTYFIYSQFIGYVLAGDLAGQLHDDTVAYLTQTPPDYEGLHTWLDTLTENGRLNSDSLPYRKCVRVLKQGRFGNTCHLW